MKEICKIKEIKKGKFAPMLAENYLFIKTKNDSFIYDNKYLISNTPNHLYSEKQCEEILIDKWNTQNIKIEEYQKSRGIKCELNRLIPEEISRTYL